MSQLSNYKKILSGLKEKIRQARLRASFSVNTQLLTMYWEIGTTIFQQEKSDGWGAKIIETLAKDLKAEFPDMRGLSPRNLRYMRDFATTYPHYPILQVPLATLPQPKQKTKNKKSQKAILQVPLAKLPGELFMQAPLAQLSWYHHITLLDKVKSQNERLFYIQKTIEMGWSRNVMVHQIESDLYKRQGSITNNFLNTVAPQNSELVKQVFKDPYKFEFIYLGKEASERDLEDALTTQMTNFLLEMGQWFAFMGRQYKIMLGEKENYFDLLFYHTRLKRYIVIDLKIDEFKPEYSGKMNFYLNLADDHLRSDGDERSIGLILCKTKDGLVAEYALRDIKNPIGIAEYKINEVLPASIKGELPSIEEIEQRMDEELKHLENPIDKKLDHLKNLISGLKQPKGKQKRSPASLERVFTKIILPLRNGIKKALTKISKEFYDTEIMIWTDTHGHQTDNVVKTYIKKTKHVNEFKISIRLKGFKSAGTKAFDIWKDIFISTNSYNYTIGFTNFEPKQIILEKLYHELLNKKEFVITIEKCIESIVDDIAQQIERIKK